ncbi:MAG: hypothetical protein IKQ16_01035 [Lentisphaeria bacterium]|jgi:hypothetical protein|nr:hypothetical protein [Lentisphaeria bacterium]
MFDLDFLKTCCAGFARMTDEAQDALRGIVQLMQTPRGLFPDRSGHEDLYYTLFGLCLAYVSDAKIDREACEKTLEQMAPADLVHRAALRYSRNLLKLMNFPRALLMLPFPVAKLDFPDLPDSAFPQGDRYSPYSCFLRNDASADLSPYRLPDGLYSNLKGSSEYGVAATAAALCLHPDETTAAALAGLQAPDGTFPGGDLLSAAVALYALKRSGHKPSYDVRAFLSGCFRPDGLFGAVPGDPAGDLEYTVYGLLAMGATA